MESVDLIISRTPVQMKGDRKMQRKVANTKYLKVQKQAQSYRLLFKTELQKERVSNWCDKACQS